MKLFVTWQLFTETYVIEKSVINSRIYFLLLLLGIFYLPLCCIYTELLIKFDSQLFQHLSSGALRIERHSSRTSAVRGRYGS